MYERARLKITALDDFPAEGDEHLSQIPIERSLSDFPERIRIKAIRKWKYLTAICPDGRVGFSRKVLHELLRVCAEQIEPGKKPPGLASFYAWRRRWVLGHFDIRALIDKWELRGRRPRTDYPDALRELISEGIESVYLTDQRESKAELRDWINGKIKGINLARAPEDALRKVSMRLINKFLDQYEKHYILKRRYGERIAAQRLTMFGKAPESSRPLQRVEVDNTPLDVLVIDDATRLVLGRPWVTVMIDRYGRHLIEEPDCLLIIGVSGAGKSTLRRTYASRFPREELEDRTVIRVLELELPSAPTIKNVAERILMALGDRYADKGSAESKTARIITLLRECRVELVMLDEFQQFVDNSGGKIEYKVADWLKQLINATRIPFVLLGLP